MRIENKEEIWKPMGEFIKRNETNIQRITNRYIPYSSYTRQDFLQETFLAGYQAVEAWERKKASNFTGYFYMELRRSYSDMVNRRIDKFEIEKQFYSKKYNDLSSLIIEYQNREKREKEEKILIRKALSVMTDKEREVWRYLLYSSKKRRRFDGSKELGEILINLINV